MGASPFTCWLTSHCQTSLNKVAYSQCVAIQKPINKKLAKCAFKAYKMGGMSKYVKIVPENLSKTKFKRKARQYKDSLMVACSGHDQAQCDWIDTYSSSQLYVAETMYQQKETNDKFPASIFEDP